MTYLGISLFVYSCSREALSLAIEDEVASSSSKFNYQEFEAVCERLKDKLAKEIEQLQADVEFLHSALDSAAECRSVGQSPALVREPTIAGTYSFVINILFFLN